MKNPARDSLELMLEYYFSGKVRILGKAASVHEGVELINSVKPDLVFLDIEMPEENGLVLFEHFDDICFAVIFTTAYKDYAIQAIKLAPVDYLLKPINVEDLRQALLLYERRLLAGIKIERDNVDKILNMLNRPVQSNMLALPVAKGFHIEKINEILYFEALENNTKVYTVSSSVFITTKSLSDIEKKLPQGMFYRIHHSHLVNLHYIRSFNKADAFSVTMINGHHLYVATRRKDGLIKILNTL